MLPGDRMCARSTCERVGAPTTGRRCESCGFVTEPWNGERSEQLRNPPDFSKPRGWSITRGMPVPTSNDPPGWQITMYLGEVFGLVVRSRGAFPQLGAKLGSVLGGELGAMTDPLRQPAYHAPADSACCMFAQRSEPDTREGALADASEPALMAAQTLRSRSQGIRMSWTVAAAWSSLGVAELGSIRTTLAQWFPTGQR